MTVLKECLTKLQGTYYIPKCYMEDMESRKQFHLAVD